MTRDQLIDFVEKRYGLPHSQAADIVDEHLNHELTQLDVARRQNFIGKINSYSDAMQFA